GGGFAPLMTLLRRERAAATHTVTTFGGDLFSPSILSSITKGEHMVTLMNAIGTDIAVIGNHEFDHGPGVAEQRIGESRFPWLGANVLTREGRPAVGTVPRRIFERGSCRLGFFGVLAEETKRLSNVGPDIEIVDIVRAAEAAVRALKDEGANIIIALTHLTFADDRRIAREVAGIHLILGGHDHEPITFVENDVMIHKSGQDAHHLGAIDMTADCVAARAQPRLRPAFGWRMLPTRGVAPDPAVQAIVDKYQSVLAAELAAPIATSSVELDSRRGSVRTRETALGNLVADALKASVGADVALLNGGGLRGNKIYPAGTVLTRKDILAEMPFGNVTVLLEVTGAQLLAALENGLSEIEHEAGRFPQVSGMSVVYDRAAPRGRRVVSLAVGGAPVQPERSYRLATIDYLANGGDGYEAFTRAKTLIDASGGNLMTTAVAAHLQALKTVAPRIEGRIKPQ
ncbi:MAG TPA: 5'-nucleotidase C-terminal domain-containing protein, partial [Terriglobales bacterium]|nr:5'-nucleotidase C-terminal domain-containing protein [Terriglobales bacterium]